MKVEELSYDQLTELKQRYYNEKTNNVSYDELSNINKLVSDSEIFDEYSGIEFSEDDFSSPSNEKLFTEGEKYIGENGIEYMLLESKNNIALLKSDSEYVVANGIRLNEENKIFWDMGSYFQNLLNATINFQSKTLKIEQQISSLMNGFKEAEPMAFFSSVLEHELNDSKQEINKLDLEKLEAVYDDYISSDESKLISEEILNRAEELDWENIEVSVIDYLKQEGVDVNKVTNEKIKELIGDVLEETIEQESDPDTIIFINEYLSGTVDELLEEQSKEDEEEDEL